MTVGLPLRLAMAAALASSLVACLGAGRIERHHDFSEQSTVISPHDEEGGRFDGARLSPGFGILYINGFTSETAEREACGGLLAEEPEHVLEVAYAMRLKLVVHADEPLVLGVRDAEGQLICGDEPTDNNANTSLTQEFRPGRYEIWVGSRRSQRSDSYRLVLSE